MILQRCLWFNDRKKWYIYSLFHIVFNFFLFAFYLFSWIFWDQMSHSKVRPWAPDFSASTPQVLVLRLLLFGGSLYFSVSGKTVQKHGPRKWNVVDIIYSRSDSGKQSLNKCVWVRLIEFLHHRIEFRIFIPFQL